MPPALRRRLLRLPPVARAWPPVPRRSSDADAAIVSAQKRCESAATKNLAQTALPTVFRLPLGLSALKGALQLLINRYG